MALRPGDAVIGTVHRKLYSEQVQAAFGAWVETGSQSAVVVFRDGAHESGRARFTTALADGVTPNDAKLPVALVRAAKRYAARSEATQSAAAKRAAQSEGQAAAYREVSDYATLRALDRVSQDLWADKTGETWYPEAAHHARQEALERLRARRSESGYSS